MTRFNRSTYQNFKKNELKILRASRYSMHRVCYKAEAVNMSFFFSFRFSLHIGMLLLEYVKNNPVFVSSSFLKTITYN